MNHPNRRIACRGTCDELVTVTSLPDERLLRLDIQAASDVQLTMTAAHRLAVVLLNACDDILAGGGRDA